MIGDAGHSWKSCCGFGIDPVMGAGVGVQERENNRHALLSLHGVDLSFGLEHWTDDGAQVFLNALDWVAPSGVSVGGDPAS